MACSAESSMPIELVVKMMMRPAGLRSASPKSSDTNCRALTGFFALARAPMPPMPGRPIMPPPIPIPIGPGPLDDDDVVSSSSSSAFASATKQLPATGASCQISWSRGDAQWSGGGRSAVGA